MSGPPENGEDYRLTSEIAVTSSDPEEQKKEKKPNEDLKDLKGKGKDDKDAPEVVR